MTILCSRCGANLALPTALDAMVVVCGYCHATTPLGAEQVRLRQAQQQAIDERNARAAMHEEERKAKRWDRWVWSLGFGGIFAVAIGTVAWTMWRTPSGPSRASIIAGPPKPVDDPQSLAIVTPAVQALADQGCRHVVSAPTAMHGNVAHGVKMSAGGNCLHLLAAVATEGARLSATVLTPTGKEHDAGSESAAALLQLEHCPTESGEHRLKLATEPAASFAYALVDCAPQREKYRDDPQRNGLAHVQGAMAGLKQARCDEVLLAPQTVASGQSLTAELSGARCMAMVAAGDADNPITVKMRTPFGKPVPTPEAAVQLRVVYCPEQEGPHAVEVKPTTDGYYTFAAMSCPKSSRARLERP